MQSVLNQPNFLISVRGYGSFFEDVLAKQAVQVFIAAPLPACRWPGKVDVVLNLFTNMGVRCKLLAVVNIQRLDPGNHTFELVHNC